MTPDKVEAALGVLSLIAGDYHPNTDKEAPLALAEMREALTEALSMLTEALAESRRDAARYRWLRDNCKREWVSDMEDNKGSPSLDIDFDAPGHDLDTAIDAAMKDPTGYELSDAEMDATTDYRGHDPDYDRKETP